MAKLEVGHCFRRFVRCDTSIFLFFSNFPQGIYDSVRTYGYWTRTSTTQYLSPWFTYFIWLSKIELPSLVLGGLGVLIALWQARNRFVLFTAFWTLGIVAAYSFVSYKTPWLTLNLCLPLAIMGGYGIGQYYEWCTMNRNRWLKMAVVMVVSLAIAFSAYQAIQLSFFGYDDEINPYSYAHTKRQFLDLVDKINPIAAASGQGTGIGVTVTSPEHWPLYWYLRDFPNVGYVGNVTPTQIPLLITSEPQAAEVEQKLGLLYQRIGTYDLRPGNRLILYLRGDLASTREARSAEDKR